ncbi:non-specific serine/threonine protein kinase [Ranunculus cassubicifolius]
MGVSNHSKFTFLLIFTWFFSLGKPDLASDKAALVLLRSAIGGKTYKWNVSDLSPCNWLGVVCDKNRVTVLRLPADEVKSVLPMEVFGNLTQLRTLSLRLNALTGKLPADLEKCSEPRNLYLQDNKFSGDIPEFLFKLHNLVRLNLARNSFSGRLSPEVNKLKQQVSK